MLTYESDTEPHAKVRDAEVNALCTSHKPAIKVKTCATHTLFDPDYLYEMNDHKMPNAYQSFLNILSKNKLTPAKPIDTFEGFKKGDFNMPDLLK